MDIQRVAVHDPITEKDARVASSGALQVQIEGLQIPAHDYIGLSYTGSNLTEVVYKSGGSGGTTVATLTLAYSGSNLISVTKT